MLKFACSAKELSCLIGNLFVELEPPCTACEDTEQITICGTTHAGEKAVLIIGKDGFYYSGNSEDVISTRESRCIGGARCE